MDHNASMAFTTVLWAGRWLRPWWWTSGSTNWS